MTGLDDNDHQTGTPNIQALGNAISEAIQKFTQCNQLNNNNNFISQKIGEIKEQSVKFHECANKSINQSDKLSKYAEEVSVFAVACADPSFTKEELLDFLKLTLEDARKNRTETEELKANFSNIMANLTNVQNECAEYSNNIQRNARMMNSSVVNELENREFQQRILNTACKIGTGTAIVTTIGSIIAAPLTGGASLSIPLIEIMAGTAGTTGIIALGSGYASNNRSSEIDALSKQMIIERDELINKISLLNGILGSIIHESCDILNFWDEQIASLNELITKLDKQGEERPSRLVALSIQKKWNVVSRECKKYNRTVRAALQMSNMAISD